MNKTWLILDCNFLCHRAKHATGGLSFEETPTGVVFGFLSYIPILSEMFGTEHIAFCWDSKTSKRKEFFPAYKQARVTKVKEMDDDEMEMENKCRVQMKKLRRKYLKMIGFRNVFCQKGYESDDLIASLCHHSIKYEDNAVIISSDHDLFQLISHNISFYNPIKRKRITLQGFYKKYGIMPHEWPMVKALAGCPGDGVIGLRGIGEKTAIKYLRGEVTSGAKLKTIMDRISIETYHHNMALVKLPYLGTKKFKLKDDQLSKKGWGEVCKILGMWSLRKKIPFGLKKGRR